MGTAMKKDIRKFTGDLSGYISKEDVSLRKRAEIRYKKKFSVKAGSFSEADTAKLIHELEVHRIELEMQNEELRMAEELLKASEIHLRELNATKDKFFSIISHDLRSPFSTIVGYSNLLVELIRCKDYEGIEEYAGIIRDSSWRVMDLLMNLFEWSSAQTGILVFNPEYVEIVALIKEATALFHDTAQQKSITITLDLPHNVTAFADKAMISTVLRNLISNAIKFTRPEGQIVISAKKNNNETRISVLDNGLGISENAIEKLFRIDESSSTKGTQNEMGNGLGLLLCKEFISKHGGEIWVKSEQGKGSEFHFTLPKR